MCQSRQRVHNMATSIIKYKPNNSNNGITTINTSIRYRWIYMQTNYIDAEMLSWRLDCVLGAWIRCERSSSIDNVLHLFPCFIKERVSNTQNSWTGPLVHRFNPCSLLRAIRNQKCLLWRGERLLCARWLRKWAHTSSPTRTSWKPESMVYWRILPQK